MSQGIKPGLANGEKQDDCRKNQQSIFKNQLFQKEQMVLTNSRLAKSAKSRNLMVNTYYQNQPQDSSQGQKVVQNLGFQGHQNPNVLFLNNNDDGGPFIQGDLDPPRTTTIEPVEIDSPDFMECKLVIANDKYMDEEDEGGEEQLLREGSVIEKVTPSGIKIHIKTESSRVDPASGKTVDKQRVFSTSTKKVLMDDQVGSQSNHEPEGGFGTFASKTASSAYRGGNNSNLDFIQISTNFKKHQYSNQRLASGDKKQILISNKLAAPMALGHQDAVPSTGHKAQKVLEVTPDTLYRPKQVQLEQMHSIVDQNFTDVSSALPYHKRFSSNESSVPDEHGNHINNHHPSDPALLNSSQPHTKNPPTTTNRTPDTMANGGEVTSQRTRVGAERQGRVEVARGGVHAIQEPRSKQELAVSSFESQERHIMTMEEGERSEEGGSKGSIERELLRFRMNVQKQQKMVDCEREDAGYWGRGKGSPKYVIPNGRNQDGLRNAIKTRNIVTSDNLKLLPPNQMHDFLNSQSNTIAHSQQPLTGKYYRKGETMPRQFRNPAPTFNKNGLRTAQTKSVPVIFRSVKQTDFQQQFLQNMRNMQLGKSQERHQVNMNQILRQQYLKPAGNFAQGSYQIPLVSQNQLAAEYQNGALQKNQSLTSKVVNGEVGASHPNQPAFQPKHFLNMTFQSSQSASSPDQIGYYMVQSGQTSQLQKRTESGSAASQDRLIMVEFQGPRYQGQGAHQQLNIQNQDREGRKQQRPPASQNKQTNQPGISLQIRKMRLESADATRSRRKKIFWSKTLKNLHMPDSAIGTGDTMKSRCQKLATATLKQSHSSVEAQKKNEKGQQMDEDFGEMAYFQSLQNQILFSQEQKGQHLTMDQGIQTGNDITFTNVEQFIDNQADVQAFQKGLHTNPIFSPQTSPFLNPNPPKVTQKIIVNKMSKDDGAKGREEVDLQNRTNLGIGEEQAMHEFFGELGLTKQPFNFQSSQRNSHSSESLNKIKDAMEDDDKQVVRFVRSRRGEQLGEEVDRRQRVEEGNAVEAQAPEPPIQSGSEIPLVSTEHHPLSKQSISLYKNTLTQQQLDQLHKKQVSANSLSSGSSFIRQQMQSAQNILHRASQVKVRSKVRDRQQDERRGQRSLEKANLDIAMELLNNGDFKEGKSMLEAVPSTLFKIKKRPKDVARPENLSNRVAITPTEMKMIGANFGQAALVQQMAAAQKVSAAAIPEAPPTIQVEKVNRSEIPRKGGLQRSSYLRQQRKQHRTADVMKIKVTMKEQTEGDGEKEPVADYDLTICRQESLKKSKFQENSDDLAQNNEKTIKNKQNNIKNSEVIEIYSKKAYSLSLSPHLQNANQLRGSSPSPENSSREQDRRTRDQNVQTPADGEPLLGAVEKCEDGGGINKGLVGWQKRRFLNTQTSSRQFHHTKRHFNHIQQKASVPRKNLIRDGTLPESGHIFHTFKGSVGGPGAPGNQNSCQNFLHNDNLNLHQDAPWKENTNMQQVSAKHFVLPKDRENGCSIIFNDELIRSSKSSPVNAPQQNHQNARTSSRHFFGNAIPAANTQSCYLGDDVTARTAAEFLVADEEEQDMRREEVEMQEPEEFKARSVGKKLRVSALKDVVKSFERTPDELPSGKCETPFHQIALNKDNQNFEQISKREMPEVSQQVEAALATKVVPKKQPGTSLGYLKDTKSSEGRRSAATAICRKAVDNLADEDDNHHEMILENSWQAAGIVSAILVRGRKNGDKEQVEKARLADTRYRSQRPVGEVHEGLRKQQAIHSLLHFDKTQFDGQGSEGADGANLLFFQENYVSAPSSNKIPLKNQAVSQGTDLKSRKSAAAGAQWTRSGPSNLGPQKMNPGTGNGNMGKTAAIKSNITLLQNLKHRNSQLVNKQQKLLNKLESNIAVILTTNQRKIASRNALVNRQFTSVPCVRTTQTLLKKTLRDVPSAQLFPPKPQPEVKRPNTRGRNDEQGTQFGFKNV